MGLFSKPKVPGIDAGALNAINQRTAQTQRGLIQQRMSGLEPINQQFKTDRGALSAQIEPGAEKLIGQYGQDMSGVNAQEQAAREFATNKFREQQFRDVPAVQQAIRNQLSGNRLMGSGAALTSLAKPTINAVQGSADFAAQNEQERLANMAKRSENMASQNFSTRKAAFADRIGLDQNTMDTLTSMGRGDLIDKFNSLSDVEGQYGTNELSIEQARQQSEIAKAMSGGSGWGSSLGSLAGMGLGAALALPTGGMSVPMSAALGGQLGGMAGGYASGENATQFDPTLLFAMAQRNAMKKNLGGTTGYSPQFGTTYSPTFSPTGMAG